ncbi:hypothetical protein [Cellulomonas sp. PhB150]|uniref:hypothetical protein n=1 Tax=Cellulomonas sp. PhB150 TaxID=2485188 RepID=UPI000F90AAB4|nr:hypothetical protein [Cellulomonas sp. PhB150]ROS27771.1 hypothetical protein EDF34_1559 [Cellulomonas sp. PhB150]
MTRLTRSVLAVVLATGAVALPGAAAQAAPTACDANSQWINSWSSKTTSNVITHASGVVIAKGSTATRTESASEQTTLTAGVSFSTTAKVGVSLPIAELGAEVGTTLSASGSKTSTSAVSVATTFTNSGTYIVFRGYRSATGYFSGGKCSSNGQTITKVSGRAYSYSKVPYSGAVWCKETGVTGFKAAAKKFCD